MDELGLSAVVERGMAASAGFYGMIYLMFFDVFYVNYFLKVAYFHQCYLKKVEKWLPDLLTRKQSSRFGGHRDGGSCIAFRQSLRRRRCLC